VADDALGVRRIVRVPGEVVAPVAHEHPHPRLRREALREDGAREPGADDENVDGRTRTRASRSPSGHARVIGRGRAELTGSRGAVPPAPRLLSHHVGSAFLFPGRTIRAVRFAATDRRIPRPLRWFAALGLLPIPGPFDEAVLLVVAVPLGLFYREPLADAWRRAGGSNPAESS
jgi:hypothetical protein